MNWLVGLGIAFGIAAVVFAIIWLIQGSQDLTATKDDIAEVAGKIDNLAEEIRLDREERKGVNYNQEGNKD